MNTLSFVRVNLHVCKSSFSILKLLYSCSKRIDFKIHDHHVSIRFYAAKPKVSKEMLKSITNIPHHLDQANHGPAYNKKLANRLEVEDLKNANVFFIFGIGNGA